MSWSGFKKNVGRATTQVMMKTGHVEKTTDREYEVEERRYRTLESAATRLQKEAKGYLDSLRAMTASQMRIAETIDAFYGDSGARDGVSRSYKQAVEDLDAETVKALDGPYRFVPTSFHRWAMNYNTGEYDEDIIEGIEHEMNFRSLNAYPNLQPSPIQAAFQDFDKTCELIDHLYRTTVLEPINRFCAYFPDVNECIKKRNHKMLDYDAMRSKVRKLTEKPDKDASKLPRAEKEAEMVSMTDFLGRSLPFPPSEIAAARSVRQRNNSGLDLDLRHDLTVPSPPKALRRTEIEVLRCATEPSRSGTSNTESTTTGHRHPGLCADRHGRQPFSGTSTTTDTINQSSARIPSGEDCVQASESPIAPLPQARRHRDNGLSASPTASPGVLFDTPSGHQASKHHVDAIATKPNITFQPTSFSISCSTANFQPSELEDIMKPFRDEFMQKQADRLHQAKAAYEQLNEQLTTELPQIIDLRVPYLDPSFEALVKIQLRFCAEAYSRMAQVQQYLDAATRDQYASGDLDARVEDVLGQIRELSIAGTV